LRVLMGMKTTNKTCGLSELMADIVLYWAEDLDIDLSVEELKELKARLTKAQNVLERKFICRQVNRIRFEG